MSRGGGGHWQSEVCKLPQGSEKDIHLENLLGATASQTDSHRSLAIPLTEQASAGGLGMISLQLTEEKA